MNKKWFKLSRTLKIELIIFGVVLIAAIIFVNTTFRGEEIGGPTPSPPSVSSLASVVPSVSSPSASTAPTSIPTSTPQGATTGNSYGSIQIIGNDICFEQTSEALSLLQTAATYYNFVTEHIGAIECVERGSGMFSWYNPPTFKAGRETRDGGKMWYAGTIAHDSCHSKQYQDGRKLSDEQAEAECLNFQFDALQAMSADQATLDWVQNAIKTRYWEVPYEDRWW